MYMYTHTHTLCIFIYRYIYIYTPYVYVCDWLFVFRCHTNCSTHCSTQAEITQHVSCVCLVGGLSSLTWPRQIPVWGEAAHQSPQVKPSVPTHTPRALTCQLLPVSLRHELCNKELFSTTVVVVVGGA